MRRPTSRVGFAFLDPTLPRRFIGWLRFCKDAVRCQEHLLLFVLEGMAMKTKRRKRRTGTAAATNATPAMIFSSDLLTPEEERELLNGFWECKMELVRVLVRQFAKLRAHRPALEPWPMAQFIRDYCDDEARRNAPVRKLHDRYVMFKHRLASANIRLAAHVAKRFRHHALSYADLLQEAVCGLMQAIDRFDVSHGTRLATYATWWIRQTLQIAVARQSHLVSLSPHHLQELGLLQQESEALAHGGKHLPSAQELAKRTGSSLEHLTHLQTATRTPVSLNAVLDDDSDFKLTEAMPDNNTNTVRTNSERQEALSFLMENLRPREKRVLDLRFGLTGTGAHSLRQIGHLLRISKERVRQIQNRALEKLRSSAERVGWEVSLLLD
jgi:RNA polymerase primary sigma factor